MTEPGSPHSDELAARLRAARAASFAPGFADRVLLRMQNDASQTDPKLVLLELKAKGPQVAYDVIKLWMTADAKTAQPVKSELYAASGKLLRTAEFTDVKTFSSGKGEWKRPAKIVMKNALVPARFSEMVWDDGQVKESISPQRFGLDDLGR